MSEPSNSAEQGGAEGELSREQIEQRAYEISQHEDAGTPDQNWEQAERELRSEQAG